MNRFLFQLFLAFYIFSSTAIAADKVVVIPLGGAKNYIYWQGNWSVDTFYKVGDGIQYEGSSYICVDAHQSTVSTSPPSSQWNLLALKGEPGGSEIGVVTSAGQVWMDRNLGALRVATKSDDPDSYGSLYQWGRLGDGHEYRTSPITVNQSSDDDAWHGSFITATRDWRSTPNDNLWQGVNGINNPCPTGFRLPTKTEWETEMNSWSSIDSAGAFASPLKIPVAGYRDKDDATIVFAGYKSYYWCSTKYDSEINDALRVADVAYMHAGFRSFAFSVRCIKE